MSEGGREEGRKERVLIESKLHVVGLKVVVGLYCMTRTLLHVQLFDVSHTCYNVWFVLTGY